MSKIHVAIAQHTCNSDLDANLAKSIAQIHEAAESGANLVVLQELHKSVYFCQQEDTEYFDLAETIPGPTSNALGNIAKALNIVIVASIFEKRAPGIYHNTAIVLDVDGSIAGKYRKMHIPDDPGFYEKFYFTPGDLGFHPISTSIGKIGVLVCWDQWFPEAARLMALGGAELLVYPTAIGWDPRDNKDEQQRQREAWQISQRGHAVANGIPVVSVNRVGHESDPGGGPGTQFWGSSFICGPQGEILTEADTDSECVKYATIDRKKCENVRRIWPFFRDRRIDHYQDILKIYCDN